jgi:AraC-like DNA-binding protein
MLQRIIDYVEDHIEDSLTPAIIAKQFYLSVSSVNVLFRVVCDVSLMEYIRNRRLTLAGQELLQSNARIIDLAYKYGYETPEDFAKAFSRFHGFPPSFVRRIYPETRRYCAIKINVEIQGGWRTEADSPGQEKRPANGYTDLTKQKGEIGMKSAVKTHTITTEDMGHKEEWGVLLALAERLDAEGIPFKVDGKTMLFAHGLDFQPDKLCLTFRWDDERRVLEFLRHTGAANKSEQPGFWYFDAVFDGMTIRCMSYESAQPAGGTDEILYRDTDLVNADGQLLHVQTVDFYLANADSKDGDFYRMVSSWASERE